MATLELLTPSSLRFTDDGDERTATTTVFDLNKLLGNHEGNFDTTGIWYTASARNVTLKGRVLCAELQDSQGNWHYKEIAILPRRSSDVARMYELSWDKSELAIERGWCDDVSFDVLKGSSFDECRNVRLVSHYVVVGLCRIASFNDPDLRGEYRKRNMNLEQFLGNRDGHFDENGKYFASSARNVRIVGTRLTAELRTISQQWREDSIDLARLIICKDGRLQAVKEVMQAAEAIDELRMTAEDVKRLIKRASGSGGELYTPLSTSGNNLRLCYILPGAWQDNLECYMASEDMNTSHYRCLSYCWGDPNVTECVSINGHSVTVRRNLAHALKRLRARNVKSAIWIDAICINQEDAKEKSHQVSRMAEIFASASEVLIWLGEDYTAADSYSIGGEIEFESSNAFIDALKYLNEGRIRGLHDFTSIQIRADGTMEYGRYTDRVISAIHSFLDSEWFTRAWTIQELMLTDNPTILYGRDTIQWETLRYAHVILTSYFWVGNAALAARNREGSSTLGMVARPLSTALRLFMKRLWHFKNMKSDYGKTRSVEGGDAALRRDNALLLLQKCRTQRASDPRDKLYAFYAIAKLTFGDLWPDYSLQAVDIYQKFTFATIMETGCFDIWSLKDAELKEHSGLAVPSLPSWAIDWNRPVIESQQPGFRYRFRLDQVQNCMAVQSRGPPARLISPRMLVVEGYELVRVAEVTKTVYTSFSEYSGIDWDSTSWEETGHVLRDWSDFLSSTFGSEPVEQCVMLNHLWELMVGREVYRRADGSIMPSGPPESNERTLAVLRNDHLFKSWWTSHTGAWPGTTQRNSHGEDGDHVEDRDLAPVTHRCRIKAEGRRLCSLSSKGLALVPEQCQAQDRIFLIRGSRWHVILRPHSIASSAQPQPQTFTLIGICLVYLPDSEQESCNSPSLSEIQIC